METIFRCGACQSKIPHPENRKVIKKPNGEVMVCNRCYALHESILPRNNTIVAGAIPSNETILQEAQRLVLGDRRDQYEEPKKHFPKVAKVASIFTGKPLTATDIVWVMIAIKLVREAYKHKRDNTVDAPGYISILHELLD